jgi:DNA polymerase
MFDESERQDILRRVYDYFRFIACFEGELFLPRDLHTIRIRRVTPDVKVESRVPRPSANPYPDYGPYESLEKMERAICGCLRCGLGAGRTKFVFGVGAANAKVVFIGEGPGAEEDRKGEPFVGRAGALLNQMLTEIEWQREDVYICNMVKCRPPNNRDPLPEEIAMCEPYLYEQLRLIQPKMLVALGRISAQALLKMTAPLKSLRGRIHYVRGVPMWVTYHPAALLRNQNLMPEANRDFQTLKRMIESGDFEENRRDE